VYRRRRAIVCGLNGLPIIGGSVSPDGEVLRLRVKGYAGSSD
jgi:hypothetical protein